MTRTSAQKKIDGIAGDPGSLEVAPDPASPTDADASVVAALYAEHFAFVWRSLRAMGVPASAVDDATQDVFVVVHRRWADFDPSGSVRGWMFGITRNVARRYRERIARRPVLHVVAEAPPLDEALHWAEAARFVEAFLDHLPEEQRAVFVLAQLQGWSAPEIADHLRSNLNTVYSRLRTARSRFERAVARHEARRSSRDEA